MTPETMVKQFQEARIKLTDGMEIRKISNYMIDVFIGNGWKHHSRYSRVKGRWVHSGGRPLPEERLMNAVQAL